MNALSKAMFQGVEINSSFEVQYNPKELKFDKAVPWEEHQTQGTTSSLEFQKVSPAGFTMELIFDTTSDQSDVRTTWVNKLLELTNPIAKPALGEAAELDKRRPTVVWFIWGAFRFEGVVESLNISYVMFAASGVPVRAKVSVKMKEWTAKESYAFGKRAAGYSSASHRMVTLEAGQSLSTLAAVYGVSVQALGELNNLADLLEAEPGLSLLVPWS